jgi:hypothetical protein
VAGSSALDLDSQSGDITLSADENQDTANSAIILAVDNAEVGRITANGLRGVELAQDREDGNRTFTNTGYLDLDALTGGAGTIGAVAVTVTTGTRAKVTISGIIRTDNAAASGLLSFRISGDTTAGADDDYALRTTGTSISQMSMVWLATGLTPGANTFELQARTTANTGQVFGPQILVEPLT